MNLLQQVKGYFKEYCTIAKFRAFAKYGSFSFSESEILECYDYIKTLKKKTPSK